MRWKQLLLTSNFSSSDKTARQFVSSGQGLVTDAKAERCFAPTCQCHALTPRREKIKKWIASFGADSYRGAYKTEFQVKNC